MSDNPGLKLVTNTKAICIMCREPVSNVYGRIGYFHQSCSKICCQKYERLTYDQKTALRQEVKSVGFKAPDADLNSWLGSNTKQGEPGFKKAESTARKK